MAHAFMEKWTISMVYIVRLLHNNEQRTRVYLRNNCIQHFIWGGISSNIRWEI